MIAFSNPAFLLHDTGQHPENMLRMKAFGDIPMFDSDYDALKLTALIHEQTYIREVREACAYVPSRLDHDTVVGPGSMQAALAGVNAAMLAAEKKDFAILRPPGHHAYPNRATGFCLFNNIAIATAHYLAHGKRIMIIDFDGHYGDGTSHIFYENDQVLFMSFHQFPAFPGNGKAEEIGGSQGKGFTINIPIPPYSGDDIFLHAFKTYLPLVEQFQPDIIGLSAGFDAHISDPLLQLELTFGTFHMIGSLIRGLDLPTFAVLEGGYNIHTLPKCVQCFLAGFNGEPVPFAEPSTSSKRACWEAYDLDLHIGIGLLSDYWKF